MAQTLKFGNGTWATKKGSTLAHNDEGGNFKPLPFTYTGAGKGTRVNKEGLIEVVENDRPRIDYLDSEDGVFLLEKAATNLITYSEAFDNSYWTKRGSSVVSGFVSPKGDLSAFKLVESTSNSIHRLQFTQVNTSSDNSYSVFLKADGVKKIGFRETKETGYFASFDLILGLVIDKSSQVTASISTFGNGWLRCVIKFPVTSSTIMAIYTLEDSYTSGDPNSTTYTGDGTSGVYIYGAMLEQSSQSSSYIPTQGTIQTRVAETSSGSGNSEVFNDSEGVLFANIAANADDLTFRLITLKGGSEDIRFGFRSNSNMIYVQIGSVAFLTHVVSDIKLFNKVAIKYGTTGTKLIINGFEVGLDTDNSSFSGINSLSFDLNGGSNFYGKTKELGYYDTALTDLELETLTSYRTWEAMVKELNLNIIHNE